MRRRTNNLYLGATATLVSLAAGCTVPPRSPDAPLDCPHRNKALEAVVNIATEPLVWPDDMLRTTGQYLITGSKANDLMTGGALVRDGDDSIYDGHGESIARGWLKFGYTNAAAGLAIYGAASSGSGSSGSGGVAPGTPPVIDIPIGPGTE